MQNLKLFKTLYYLYMKRNLIKNMENKKIIVVRVDSDEFELDNGDVFPQLFDIDEDITVEQFQELLDESKDMVLNHLKKINGLDNE